ncbi:MAG: hypothetical protein C4K47_07820 [Candidatus Thorarchaeota archaeon]|nr:MAG: hypothetical protein C4K47_07820 [Candidatus Thorarchaeota archaeon]
MKGGETLPKKEKHGKAIGKAGKGAERGLHKGWDVAKGTAHDVGKRIEEHGEKPEEEEKED